MLLLTMLTACKVVDAPEALDDLMVFGLLGYEDPEVRVAFADAVDAQLIEGGADLESGVRTTSLTPEQLVEAGFNEEPGEKDVLGIVAGVTFASDFDAVVETVTGDMSEVIKNTVRYDIVETTDRDCFLAGECDSLDMDVSRDLKGFWGTGSQDVTLQFRWVDRSDGVRVLMSRALAPDPFQSNSVIYKTEQHYQLYVMAPGDAGPQKVEAHWVEAELIGVDLPDRIILDSIVNSIGTHRDGIDGYITGE